MSKLLTLSQIYSFDPGALYAGFLESVQDALLKKVHAYSPPFADKIQSTLYSQNDDFDFENRSYRNQNSYCEAVVIKNILTGTCVRISFFGLETVNESRIEFCGSTAKDEHGDMSIPILMRTLLSSASIEAILMWLTIRRLPAEFAKEYVPDCRDSSYWDKFTSHTQIHNKY